MKRIYLDHAATTAVHPHVLAAMMPHFASVYGNPSSLYTEGREAKKAVEHAREQVQKALNAARADEIIFTGGGSEADNTAIFGVARSLQGKGKKHLITTTFEHHAVLHPCEMLEQEGFEVTYLPVDEYGLVTPEQVEAAIRPETALITIMFANNEIGSIQPIAEIGAVARRKGVIFHTDAVQAVGALDIDVQAMNIDLLSLSAHKLYGPKGVGALYVRKGLRVPPLIYGGAQERKRRAGTENVPGIVGLGAAIERATAHRPVESARQIALRDKLIHGLLERIPECRLNGHPTKRLPNNCNVSIKYVEGEALLLRLDFAGVAASSGSACTSGSLDPSHVLLAIGLPHEIAHGSLRLTLGEENTEADVDTVLEGLPKIVETLRAMSPLFDVRDDIVSYEGDADHGDLDEDAS